MFDFGIGATELMVIAMVALIVVGPKELPKLLRTLAQFSRKIRSMASEFQRHVEDAAKDAGVDDIKKEVNKMTNFTVTKDFEKDAREIDKSVRDAAKPSTGTKTEDKAKTDDKAKTEGEKASAKASEVDAEPKADAAKPAAAKSAPDDNKAALDSPAAGKA